VDEITNDLDKVRQLWSSSTATAAKAKAKRRNVEKATRKSSEFWTGRSAQLNIRMTPELRADVQEAASEFGMSMADFFETAVLEFITKRRTQA
jgi:predicted HicB family RNase H-like nuclease